MLIRLLKTVLLWTIPLSMAAAALWLQTPLLYKLRWHLMLIIGLVHLLQRFHLPHRFWGAGQPPWRIRARGFLCGGACLIALGGAVHQANLKGKVMGLAPRHLQRVGAHLMVGYTDFEEVKALAALGAVAGVFVTKRNLEDGGYHELQAELAQLQQLRREGGLPPLLVAADQEGGAVSRLSPPLTRLPPLAQVVDEERPDRETLAAVERYGAVHGAELAALGVNVNFGPVVDLRLERAAGSVDLYSKIATRAIARDPWSVSRVARVYSEALGRHGVKATLKHFPGLGRVTADTHFFTASLEAPLAELERQDWRPFRAVSRQTDAWIMLGHVKLPALDEQRLVSSSKPVVDGLIRRRWGHQGILVTDDFCMGPVWNEAEGFEGALVNALNAGVDLILIAMDVSQIYRALWALHQAHRRGMLDEQMLARSARRLRRAVPRLEHPNIQRITGFNSQDQRGTASTMNPSTGSPSRRSSASRAKAGACP